MKPEREGIIWALLTDEERAEMPIPESRQWYGRLQGVNGWNDDDDIEIMPSMAYRPRPKPAKSWQDEFEEWAKGKKFWFNDLTAIVLESIIGDEAVFSFTNGSEYGVKYRLNSNLRGSLVEAEEYIEPYTQETLPWPLVVRIDNWIELITRSCDLGVYSRSLNITWKELSAMETPSGDPCGIRKWRKKS